MLTIQTQEFNELQIHIKHIKCRYSHFPSLLNSMLPSSSSLLQENDEACAIKEGVLTNGNGAVNGNTGTNEVFAIPDSTPTSPDYYSFGTDGSSEPAAGENGHETSSEVSDDVDSHRSPSPASSTFNANQFFETSSLLFNFSGLERESEDNTMDTFGESQASSPFSFASSQSPVSFSTLASLDSPF
jgi:hypothetical protein